MTKKEEKKKKKNQQQQQERMTTKRKKKTNAESGPEPNPEAQLLPIHSLLTHTG